MSTVNLETYARERLGDRWACDVPLAPLTTFRVGGPAQWLADVRSVTELRALVALASAAGVSVTVLGGGSNVVVPDAGLRGVVVRLHLSAITLVAADCVRADAGVTINGLVRWLIGRGLAGLEAWAGTPGTVGGAIYGNAHWMGANMGDHVRQVTLVSPTGDLIDVPAADMGFAYDTSRLQHTGEIVVSADLHVAAGLTDVLRSRARDSLHYRKRTQPLAVPSAGCIFRNPDPDSTCLPDGIPRSAGALIDRAGLKGRRVGGAVISQTHGNFIVNDGRATAADIRALVEMARAAVRDRYDIVLEDEIVFLGTV